MTDEEVWQPDEFLKEFAGEAFDVEQHATKILKQGNMNDEVSNNFYLVKYSCPSVR